MARCRAACLALLLLLGAVPVLAQTLPSPIPEDTRRGYIRHAEEMAVTVDDKAMQLAAGATVRNQQNLIIVRMSIPRGGAWADYVLDRAGQGVRVWLLTPDELAQPKSGGR